MYTISLNLLNTMQQMMSVPVYFSITSIRFTKMSNVLPKKKPITKCLSLTLTYHEKKNQFITSIFRKPRFSGVFSHFDSFIPRGYKFNLVSTFISVAILFVVVWNFSIKILCNFKRFLKRIDKTISILAGASNIYKQNWF